MFLHDNIYNMCCRPDCLTVLALQERDDLDVPCILHYDSLFNLF